MEGHMIQVDFDTLSENKFWFETAFCESLWTWQILTNSAGRPIWTQWVGYKLFAYNVNSWWYGFRRPYMRLLRTRSDYALLNVGYCSVIGSRIPIAQPIEYKLCLLCTHVTDRPRITYRPLIGFISRLLTADCLIGYVPSRSALRDATGNFVVPREHAWSWARGRFLLLLLKPGIPRN